MEGESRFKNLTVIVNRESAERLRQNIDAQTPTYKSCLIYGETPTANLIQQYSFTALTCNDLISITRTLLNNNGVKKYSFY